MDQEKIGRFIASVRKEQNLTQEQLAEKLEITSKAVSKWECGKGLPDASIMMELCEILKITVNDLLSGEKIKQENYQKKLEENILDTIDYSNKKVLEKNKVIYEMILFFGLGLVFMAFTIYPTDSSWGSIHSIMGLLLSTFGFVNIKRDRTMLKKCFLGIFYFMIGFLFLLLLDFSNVILNKVAPRFSYLIQTTEDMILYKTPLCNVYRINRNTKNEYYIIDVKKEYTEDTVPITPFNRDKSGIESILPFQNPYIGNNSNTSLLVDHLPLSEYGYVLEIDSYINENQYLEKSLLYNAVSLFLLIENVQKLTFNFSGNTYMVNRSQIEECYPHFKKIVLDGINQDNFNQYVEGKMNDNDFVEQTFTEIFIS